MKMKRFVCILLTAVMLMSFVGCGQIIDDTPVTDNDNPAVTPDSGKDNEDNSEDDGWGYSFSSDFIEINGLQYIWTLLDEETKTALGEMMNAIGKVEIYCSLSQGIPYEDKEQFLTLLSNCTMGYTYDSNRFKTHTNEDGRIVGITINYNVDYEQEAYERTDALMKAVDDIVSKMPNGSDYEKIKYLHDSLVLSCDYSENAISPFTAYGALVEGKATCQGYADAMHLLLARAGFSTCFATGIGEAETVTHKWNYVLCSDGNWYVIDSTWDDPEGKDDPNYINYDYLMISDEVLLADHKEKFESPYFTTPAATSMDLNYHIMSGYYATSYEEAKEILQKQATECGKNGTKYIYIRFADLDTFLEAKEKLFSGDYEMQDILKQANKEAGSSIVTTAWTKLLREPSLTMTITLKYE